jgi:hypothetical protein
LRSALAEYLDITTTPLNVNIWLLEKGLFLPIGAPSSRGTNHRELALMKAPILDLRGWTMTLAAIVFDALITWVIFLQLTLLFLAESDEREY